jgi:CRISPR-associated protein Cst1
MLRFTGHPLFDVGLAAITAFARKSDPEQVDHADLEAIADYMARNYRINPLRSFLTAVFMNSGFTQPAFFSDSSKQELYAQRVLKSYREDTPVLDQVDVFLGLPIPDVTYDVYGRLEPGRAFRQHIPLITSEDVINFHPNANVGLPVSGLSMLVIHALPLGCAKCQGKLLAVHSDHPKVMLHFAREFWEHNSRAIQLAQQQGSSKLVDNHLSLRTLLVDTLLKADQLKADYGELDGPVSVTAYHLSNGKNPYLEIYHLPMEVIDFLRLMNGARYTQAWRAVVQQAWQTAPKKPKQEGEEFIPKKNYLYEDLFRLPENASRFIRTYFLRTALRMAREGAEPNEESPFSKNHLVPWGITAVFLERIMNMEKERIDHIRALGDGLADYINTQNDRRFFTAFYTENRYEFFRTVLIKANLAHVKNGHPPIIALDTYLKVFEENEEFARPDWKLARDLVFIRMVERLHEAGWLGKNPDALPEQAVIPEEAEEE